MNKKILLIEANETLGSAVIEGFKKQNFETLWVKDGPSGIKQLSEFHPDLVVLDMLLPGFDGKELLERKKETDAKDTPVIIISGTGQGLEMEHFTSEIKDYINKTKIGMDEIISKANEYFSKENMNNDTTLEGKKILWVEDDAFLSDIIAKKLALNHFVLFHAISAEDAGPMLEKETPDIIMLDILLPGINGLEFLEKIRGDARFKDIPVIILSNFAQKADIDKGRELGAAKFLVKATLTLDEIIAEIGPIIGTPVK